MLFNRRNKKKDYLKDYVINEKGEYEYSGARYAWANGEIRESFIKKAWLMEVGLFIVQLAAGCVPAPGVSSEFYLLVPYALGIAAAVSVGLSLWTMTSEEDPMRDHVYEASVPKIPTRTLVTIAACGICAIAEICYVALFGAGDKVVSAFIFIVLEAAAAAIALMLRMSVLELEWRRF